MTRIPALALTLLLTPFTLAAQPAPIYVSRYLNWKSNFIVIRNSTICESAWQHHDGFVIHFIEYSVRSKETNHHKRQRNANNNSHCIRCAFLAFFHVIIIS